ncbi:Hypothetical protein A7982_00458 [Minicystis rosea]|nr:Hypothetical protein A7982_00458 [Minicystis rosea]
MARARICTSGSDEDARCGGAIECDRSPGACNMLEVLRSGEAGNADMNCAQLAA